MFGPDTRRILVMAAMFVVALAVFTVSLLLPRPRARAVAQAQVTMPTVMTTASMRTADLLTPPPLPRIPAPVQRTSGSVPDIFAGGQAPKPQVTRPVVTPDPPPIITVCALPAVVPSVKRIYVDPVPTSMIQRIPIGRYVGLVTRNEGEIVAAIIEDRMGTQSIVRVGEVIGDYCVQAISPEALLLRDAQARLHRLTLSGPSASRFTD